MDPMYGTIGVTLSLSASQPVSYDGAGYAALSYTKVGNIGNIGELTDEWQSDEFKDLESGATKTAKTFRNTPNIQLTIGYNKDNTGQQLLETAFADADNDYSVKVAYPDGEVDYFQVKVMKLTKAAADGTFRKRNVALAVQADTNGNYYVTV